MSWLILPGNLVRFKGGGEGRVVAVDREKGEALCLIWKTEELKLVELSSVTPWAESPPARGRGLKRGERSWT